MVFLQQQMGQKVGSPPVAASLRQVPVVNLHRHGYLSDASRTTLSVTEHAVYIRIPWILYNARLNLTLRIAATIKSHY